MKNILIVYNIFCARGEAVDTVYEDDLLNPEPELAKALREAGWNVEMACIDGNLHTALSPYDPSHWVIFNLYEDWYGWTIGAARAPHIFESLGFAYTGADAAVLRLTSRKDLTKARLDALGIPTPRYQVFKREPGAWPYRFPAIVKPVAECGSMGITDSSVVLNQAALDERVWQTLRTYRQPALVEEFVEGREVTLGIWGNQELEVLPPAEVDFSTIDNPLQRIFGFNAKWERSSFQYRNTPIRCPTQLEPGMEQRLRDLAVRVYRGVGLRDFCRMDIRLGKDGPMIVDVNSNPAPYADSEFARQASVAGYTYPATVDRIACWALERIGQAPALFNYIDPNSLLARESSIFSQRSDRTNG